MSYKDWYTVNTHKDGYQVVAVDKDLNYVKEYIVTLYNGNPANCGCIAGHTWCRHKKLIVMFNEKNLINSRQYYNFDRNKWLDTPKQEDA